MRLSTILILVCLCASKWVNAYADGESSSVTEMPKLTSGKLTSGEIGGMQKTSASLSPEMQEKSNVLLSQTLNFLHDEEFEAVIIRAKELLDIDPANSAAHYYLAEAYSRLKDINNAVLHYRYAINFNPDSQEAVLAQVRLTKIEKSVAAAPAASAIPATTPLAASSVAATHAVPASPTSTLAPTPASSVPANVASAPSVAASAIPATTSLAAPSVTAQ